MDATKLDWPGKLQTFKFDLQGYAIFREFLDPAQVAELNAILEPVCSRQKGSVKFDFVTEGPKFLDLMTDRRILAICDAWMGAYYRFAGAWGIHGHPQNRNLHAGPGSGQGLNQFQQVRGRPVCSCLVFGLLLEPQHPGDGGFVLLPGSHKLSGAENGDYVYRELFGSRLDPSCVVQPALDAGDLIVFAEATIHGTERWKPADRPRRNLYYKYSHGYCTYLPESDAQLHRLRQSARTDLERRLLDGPWVRSHGGAEAKKARARPATVAG